MQHILMELTARIETSYFVLLILLALNSVADLVNAARFDRLSPSVVKRFGLKIATYSVAILALRLLEIGLAPLWRTTLLSEIAVTFLAAFEAFGLLENLALLGVPIPANLMALLIKSIRIPGLSQALHSGAKGDKGIQEIDQMLEYQIPSFHNARIRQLLQIRCLVWRNIAAQLKAIALGNTDNQKDLLYYKAMSLIELGMREVDDRVREAGIPEEVIATFTRQHKPRTDTWLEKVKEICYAEGPAQGKQMRLVDSLIIFLYRTIMESLQIYNTPGA